MSLMRSSGATWERFAAPRPCRAPKTVANGPRGPKSSAGERVDLRHRAAGRRGRSTTPRSPSGGGPRSPPGDLGPPQCRRGARADSSARSYPLISGAGDPEPGSRPPPARRRRRARRCPPPAARREHRRYAGTNSGGLASSSDDDDGRCSASEAGSETPARSQQAAPVAPESLRHLPQSSRESPEDRRRPAGGGCR